MPTQDLMSASHALCLPSEEDSIEPHISSGIHILFYLHFYYAHTLQIQGLFRPQLILRCNYPTARPMPNTPYFVADLCVTVTLIRDGNSAMKFLSTRTVINAV
mgnify:CR=1 FL=1